MTKQIDTQSHTSNIQKLEMMFELQEKLNNETNGVEWKSGVTKNDKSIDWYRCIYMEAAEFIGSYPAWKHWKNINAEPDLPNAKIELVDIWHFVMSEAIRTDMLSSRGNLYKHIVMPAYSENSIDTSFENISPTVEMMINAATAQKSAVSNINVITKLFFTACAKMGLGMDDLYAMYVGKNILNKFRQDNGYKDGSYIKIWNSKEDNEVMMSIILEETTISPDGLYNKLQGVYRSL